MIDPFLLLVACADPSPPAAPVGDGPFAEGCPEAGRALARRIGVDGTLPGHVAVGTRGDFLLANERAAFVITEPDKGSTYAYYGGLLADAVAMEGCAPAGDDGLDEIALVLGQLELADFDRSVLRAFRGTRATVRSDGSDGGPAVVRVEGIDDTHWLVEGELLNAAVGSGRTASAPFGLELVVDYVLDPDEPTLRLEWTLRNPTETSLELLTASLLSFAPTYDVAAGGSSALSFAGLSLTADIPLVAATDGFGAYGFALENGHLAYTPIAGIDVSLDLDQALLDPIRLPPGGEETRVTRFAVGRGDGPTATEPLLAAVPGVVPFDGFVHDPDGRAVVFAWVDLWGDGGAGPQVVDRARTGADGYWSLVLPALDWDWSVAVRDPGRDDTLPIAIEPGGVTLHLPVGPVGSVAVEVSEDGGVAPARIELTRDDGARATLWTTGRSTEPLAPGHWRWVATRGFEVEPDAGEVRVPEGGTGTLRATLARAVDTSGWTSIDTHVHTAESPDSRMDPGQQLVHAAAHGVDVVLHTEHEHIVSYEGVAAAAGVEAFVAELGGQEVTATVPEHLTMFPVTPDGSPRGGFVRWYGMDLGEVFAAMHARSGGGINILNHPGYMDRIGWDVVDAVPTLTEPAWLGLPADAELWSWDFEGIEVMNGTGSPFVMGNHRFESWQSLLNAGHRIAPVGCSDDHGGWDVGFPRTWFAGDDPVAAFRAGRTMVSAGAFARVDVDGHGPGELVAAGDSVDLRVRISAARAVDVTHVVVFADCDGVAKVAATAPHGVTKLDTVLTLPVSGDTQLVVAAFGAEPLPLGLPSLDPATVPRVLTGAIFVDADRDGEFDAPGGRVCSYDLAAP